MVHTASSRLIQVRKMYEYNTHPHHSSPNVWVTGVKMTQPKHEDIFLSLDLLASSLHVQLLSGLMLNRSDDMDILVEEVLVAPALSMGWCINPKSRDAMDASVRL